MYTKVNCNKKKKVKASDLMEDIWNTMQSFIDVSVVLSEIFNVFPTNVQQCRMEKHLLYVAKIFLGGKIVYITLLRITLNN